MEVPCSCRDAVYSQIRPTEKKEDGKTKPHSLISACLFSEGPTTVRTQCKSGLKTVDLIVRRLSSRTRDIAHATSSINISNAASALQTDAVVER